MMKGAIDQTDSQTIYYAQYFCHLRLCGSGPGGHLQAASMAFAGAGFTSDLVGVPVGDGSANGFS